MVHSRSLSRTIFSCASLSAYSSLSRGGTSTFMKNVPANPGFCLLSPTPHAVWQTKRRKPYSFIATTMFAEPAEATPFGSPGLRGRSGLLGSREPRTLITASLPATASHTGPGSYASPTTIFSLWWRAVILEESLTKAVTSCPSAIALSTRRRPVPPVDPKITNLMVAPLFVRRRATARQCTQVSPASDPRPNVAAGRAPDALDSPTRQCNYRRVNSAGPAGGRCRIGPNRRPP